MPTHAAKPAKRRTTPPAEPAAPTVHPTVRAMTTYRDLLDHLGVPAERVRLVPFPGTATEADVIRINESSDRPSCELIDGVLVEKAVSAPASLLQSLMIYLLMGYVRPRRLGLVYGADAMARMLPGNIRVPDVSFYSWNRLVNGRVPMDAVLSLAPDLAIEVLSRSNTKAEMARKRAEYFAAGVRLYWEIDPRKRTAVVYDNPDRGHRLGADEALDGGDVIPGFTLPLAELFGELDQTAPG